MSKDIVTCITRQPVVAGAADKHIIAAATDQRVSADAGGDRVVQRIAGERQIAQCIRVEELDLRSRREGIIGMAQTVSEP